MGDCFSKVHQHETNNDANSSLSIGTTLSSQMASAPVIIQASARHTATVIFLHGLGDTGHGWAPVFQQIKAPHVKYILPTAPTIPVTLNMGMRMPSWFDLKGLSLDATEDEAGIKQACVEIQALVEKEISAGISSNRILLGGFSQGGGLALYSALTFGHKLAGILALSCWLPLHKQFPGNNTVNLDIPILQCHGDSDPLVVPQIGQVTAQYLKAFNKHHTIKIYPGMGHHSCDQEVNDMKQFIQTTIP